MESAYQYRYASISTLALLIQESRIMCRSVISPFTASVFVIDHKTRAPSKTNPSRSIKNSQTTEERRKKRRADSKLKHKRLRALDEQLLRQNLLNIFYSNINRKLNQVYKKGSRNLCAVDTCVLVEGGPRQREKAGGRAIKILSALAHLFVFLFI
jgi:hypothetical protein